MATCAQSDVQAPMTARYGREKWFLNLQKVIKLFIRSPRYVYLGEKPETEEVEVPDFLGLNRQQASDLAGSLGLYILVTGNQEISPGVTVTAQDLPRDTPVPLGTTITLEFTDTAARD